MSAAIRLLHIVDDNELDRWVFRKQMLNAASVNQVEESANGEDAKSFLEQCLQPGHAVPELILIDVHLPGEVDGWELLAWIRKQPKLERTKVVLFTFSPQLQTQPAEFVEDSAATIHAKPITQEVAQAIAAWFGGLS